MAASCPDKFGRYVKQYIIRKTGNRRKQCLVLCNGGTESLLMPAQAFNGVPEICKFCFAFGYNLSCQLQILPGAVALAGKEG